MTSAEVTSAEVTSADLLKILKPYGVTEVTLETYKRMPLWRNGHATFFIKNTLLSNLPKTIQVLDRKCTLKVDLDPQQTQQKLQQPQQPQQPQRPRRPQRKSKEEPKQPQTSDVSRPTT